jgi:hypothetical protein
MAIQGQGLVLRKDIDVAQIGVDAVGKGYINNSIIAAEWHRRFGPVARQGKEPLPSAACQ